MRVPPLQGCPPGPPSPLTQATRHSNHDRLAKQKREREEAELAARRAAAEAARARAASTSGSQAPARWELKRLERTNKFATRAVAVAPTSPEEEAQLRAAVEEEQRRYEELKQELSLWTAGLTAACFAATYAFYTKEIAASYGVGALGGYLYLRLLNKSVDSLGTGGAGGALGQPRLLIPVILVLAFNRWNQLKADEVGLHLQLLPMLLGFFTYKGAVIAKNFGQLAKEMMPGEQDPPGADRRSAWLPAADTCSGLLLCLCAGTTAAAAAPAGTGSTAAASSAPANEEETAQRRVDSLSVDRAFRNKILSG